MQSDLSALLCRQKKRHVLCTWRIKELEKQQVCWRLRAAAHRACAVICCTHRHTTTPSPPRELKRACLPPGSAAACAGACACGHGVLSSCGRPPPRPEAPPQLLVLLARLLLCVVVGTPVPMCRPRCLRCRECHGFVRCVRRKHGNAAHASTRRSRRPQPGGKQTFARTGEACARMGTRKTKVNGTGCERDRHTHTHTQTHTHTHRQKKDGERRGVQRQKAALKVGTAIE